MQPKKAYKFRIYPDEKRQKEIDERLILAQQFYNKILEKSISSYKDKKAKISMAQFNKFVKGIIEEDSNYLKLYSQTRCEIEYRLLKAYQNFFRRVKQGNKKPGFPRFRSRDKYKSITYPQDNGSFRIEKGMLRIARIGRVKIELHRNMEGSVKTMTVKKAANQYYVVFSTEHDTIIQKVQDTNPVGVDMGLTTFAALSDGRKILRPNFTKKNEKHIAKWQRTVARKMKGSKNREKAKIRLEKKWHAVNNQSLDYLNKITNTLVKSGYTSFAMEKLAINNMVKNHKLARSIYGASWSKFKDMLSYKAESAGLKVMEVNARDTTKTCSNCGNVQDMPLGKTIYFCNNCYMEKDKDINASINILKRAREGHSQSNASGDVTATVQQAQQVISMNQEHSLQFADEAHML